MLLGGPVVRERPHDLAVAVLELRLKYIHDLQYYYMIMHVMWQVSIRLDK